MANKIFWNILVVVIICEVSKGVPISEKCKNCKLFNLQINENSPPILVPAEELSSEENSQNQLYRYLIKKSNITSEFQSSDVTEGPDDFNTATTEDSLPKHISIPVFIQQPQTQPQKLPVIYQTYSGNSVAVNPDQKPSDSFSIHISTTIDLGRNLNGESPIFNSPQGTILGPLVFSTTIQLTPNNVPKNNNGCIDCYDTSDDEDYYDEFEGSGDKTTVSSLDDLISTVEDSSIEI